MRYFIFKPDGIGDFIIATGAIRLLAEEAGEENLVLCVRPLLASLAQAQFPRAVVIAFPVAEKRKRTNLFLENLFSILPVWRQMRGMRFDAAVCLRSMRNYLHKLFFYSARAPRFIASENILLRNGNARRRLVYGFTRALRRPELLPYPDCDGKCPTELEANRRVVSQVLGREVSVDDVLPALKTSTEQRGDYWLLCPASSMGSKDYPFDQWRAIFALIGKQAAGREILLSGSEDQRPRLEELAGMLTSDGLQARVQIPPDLVSFVDLVGAATLVLTVDTAAAHIATALDRPCVIIFSGLHPGMFAPWQRGEKQRWLLPDLPSGTHRKHWRRGFPPERVAGEIRDLLAERSG